MAFLHSSQDQASTMGQNWHPPASTGFADAYRTVARQPRFFIPGVTQHVIQRGNNRADMFRSPCDYEVFLHALREVSLRYPVDIHAYALMTNHVHLMVTPGSATALPAAMQAVGRRYVRFFNHQHHRTGGLFEGRYRSVLIDTDAYWFTCLRYVEFNPVRAGLVATPEAYRWSSYPVHAFGTPDTLLVPHALYLGLGETAADRQRSWRAICGNPLPDDQLAEIRRAINTGRALGELILPDAAPA